jgi:hypothetical protein
VVNTPRISDSGMRSPVVSFVHCGFGGIDVFGHTVGQGVRISTGQRPPENFLVGRNDVDGEARSIAQICCCPDR